jgi:hypothetical protein
MQIARGAFVAAVLLTIGVGCADIAPTAATATPTTTPTPVPTATPTATPMPTKTPMLESTPAARGTISDVDVRLRGLWVEGSFTLDDEPVSVRYRPAQLKSAQDGLRVTGSLTYTIEDTTRTVREVGGLLTPADDACAEMLFITDAVRLPALGIVVPTQALTLDLNAVESTSANVPAHMICQATRMAMEQPNSAMTQFLIQQANALLQP